jgi:hypothetical protein
MNATDFNLDLIFKLETSASGLFAAVFDQSAGFRRWFFGHLELAHLAELEWSTTVEQDSIDIRMDAEDDSWTVLLENKVRRGSKQSGQLEKYYDREQRLLARNCPDCRVLMVYLAPMDIGKSEVSALQRHKGFREGKDCARHCSWQEVLDQLESDPGGFVADPQAQWFLSKAAESIGRTIEEAKDVVYEVTDERRKVLEVVSSVRERLAASGHGVGFMAPWPDVGRIGFSTKKTNLTLWYFLHFKADKKPPHNPIDLVDPSGRLQLTLHAQMHLSGTGRKNKALRERWAAKIEDGRMTVPGFGDDPVFELRDDGWVHREVELLAEKGELEDQLVDLGRAALDVVKEFEQ